MATFRGGISQDSGIPLGGIGTGNVEIRPDGYLHDWQVFNLGQWAPRQPEGWPSQGPAMGPGALAFFVRACEQDRNPVVRRLGLRQDQNNPNHFCWLKSVREIDFAGRFPVARLTYRDPTLPVGLESLFFSPFFPQCARESGTPGFHAVFRARNRSSRTVRLSLLATLRNPLAWDARDRRLANTVFRQGSAAGITMRTAATAGSRAGHGSLSLAVSGGTPTWIAGDYSEFLNGFLVSHRFGHVNRFGDVHESFWRDFRCTGRLCNSIASEAPGANLRLSDDRIDGLSDSQVHRLVKGALEHAFAISLWNRIRDVDPAALATTVGLRGFLKEVALYLRIFAGRSGDRQNWGHAALSSCLDLAPGQEREVAFSLAWHFPNHFSALGNRIGHMYENWFADSEAAGRFLVRGFRRHRSRTVQFSDTMFDTTLPACFPDAWSGRLSTLVKCTWWTRAGDFGVWEGLGCCGFRTTDITYQGSFSIAALFPELQKRQMETGARFQRADGRMPHFFTPDLRHVNDGFDRVDMNPQFVLLAARDYLWTGDRQYVRRLWPHIVAAMESTQRLDGDGDGLPDHGTRMHTYDSWNFRGTPAYIAGLWLAALLAAARIADDLGYARQADKWRALFARAAAAFDTRLWNGSYYALWVSDDDRDDCCMTDQLSGHWFASLLGLGHIRPPRRVRAVLRAVLKHNYSREDGLINGNYPTGVPKRFVTWQNLQQMAPWTGIEYAMAAMLLDASMPRQARALVANVHDRYARAGRFWNHNECGDHYYRAMSSWAVLCAAAGFKLDSPRGTLTMAPPFAHERFRAPWFAPAAWGAFEQAGGRVRLACLHGALRLRELRLAPLTSARDIRVNGKRVPACNRHESGLRAWTFARGLILRSGDVLSV